MSSIKRFLLPVFFITIEILSFQACDRASGEFKADPKIKNNRHLIMGLSADNPPFEFKKKGEIMGFDVDLARELAHELGYFLTIENMEFSALIPALQASRVDFIMSGISVTEQRKKNLDFSEIYFSCKFALIVLKQSQFFNESDFQGKRIGVQLGTTMEKYLKEKKQEHYPSLEIVSLGTNPFIIEEVKAGRLFGMITEEVQSHEFIKANPHLKSIALKVTEDGFAIAFKKMEEGFSGVQSLRDAFNFALHKLKRKGKLEVLRKKWITQ